MVNKVFDKHYIPYMVNKVFDKQIIYYIIELYTYNVRQVSKN